MTTTFLDLDGGKLAVEVAGDGPLVVCSPGLGDTRDAYAPLAAHLINSGYRVVCVDLRGHGDSTAGFARYGDEATADDLLAVIEKFGGGPAVLIGASMSSAAAVIAAGRRPDQIAGLIVIGAFLRNGIGPAMQKILQVALTRPWGPAVWRSQAAKLWPGLGDGAKQRAARSTALATRPGYWPAFKASAAADHSVVAPWIDRVTAPVLVVIGDVDPDWKDPLAEAQWVASNFADVQTVVVHGAGHAPMLERPAIVNPAFSEFLGKVGFAGSVNRASA